MPPHNPTPNHQDEAKASSTVEFQGPMPDVGTVFRDVEIKGVQNFGVFVEILPGLQVRGGAGRGRAGRFGWRGGVGLGNPSLTRWRQRPKTNKTRYYTQGLVHVSELATKRVVSVDALYKVTN